MQQNDGTAIGLRRLDTPRAKDGTITNDDLGVVKLCAETGSELLARLWVKRSASGMQRHLSQKYAGRERSD